jgi:hypothetical protein
MKFLQICVLTLGLFVFVNNAQTITDRSEKSVLSGTVFDEQGAVIQRAKITFTNQAGMEFIVLSNDDGIYKIELNEGKYKIEFSQEGFQTSIIDVYKLAFKTKMQLDISLEVRNCGNPKMDCHKMIFYPKKIN